MSDRDPTHDTDPGRPPFEAADSDVHTDVGGPLEIDGQAVDTGEFWERMARALDQGVLRRKRDRELVHAAHSDGRAFAVFAGTTRPNPATRVRTLEGGKVDVTTLDEERAARVAPTVVLARHRRRPSHLLPLVVTTGIAAAGWALFGWGARGARPIAPRAQTSPLASNVAPLESVAMTPMPTAASLETRTEAAPPRAGSMRGGAPVVVPHTTRTKSAVHVAPRAVAITAPGLDADYVEP